MASPYSPHQAMFLIAQRMQQPDLVVRLAATFIPATPTQRFVYLKNG